MSRDAAPIMTVAAARSGAYRGAIGGILIVKSVGYALGLSNGYAPIFAVAGKACIAALTALHLVSPPLSPPKDPVS